MKLKAISAVLVAMLTVGSATSQSLTPEQITAMVDQKMNELNPYQSLLNDPDPERSRLAMQVMLESGDAELERMALEFGLLSPSTAIKRTAFEAWLKTGPVLTIRFDGTDVESRNYPGNNKNYWNAAQDGKMMYWRIAVGDFLEEKKCFENTYDRGKCFITINSDGIFFTPGRLNGRANLTDEGSIVGTSNMSSVGEPVPFSIKIMD